MKSIPYPDNQNQKRTINMRPKEDLLYFNLTCNVIIVDFRWIIVSVYVVIPMTKSSGFTVLHFSLFLFLYSGSKCH